MNNRRLCLVSFIIALQVSAAAAQPRTPTQAYLDCRVAIKKATTIAEVLPHVSAMYRAMLQSKSKADQQKFLEGLKEPAAYQDLKITKETIAGNKCTLEGTATSDRGNALKGKVMLVKEGGTWKLDAESWGSAGG
jgi:hypothetical protein